MLPGQLGTEAEVNGDPYKTLTAAAVLVVAAIAATVSYLHIARLALAYGQEPLAAYLLPLSIDGVVATSSLVMLRSARASITAPWLAQAGLALSVAATLAANVASGMSHGWHGALIAGWPAVGFVISAETAIAMSRKRAKPAPEAKPVSAPRPTAKAAPKGASRKAKTAAPEVYFRDVLEAGQLPSVRRIRRELHMGQPKAQEVQAALAASVNGHSPG
jgi:hypothetical protein